jgi:phage terminase small subunit
MTEVPIKRKESTEFKFTAKQKTNQHSTHTGIKLSIAEELFIEEYINSGGDVEKAYLATGRKAKNIKTASKNMLKPHIKEEISYRLDAMAAEQVADRNEILSYLTSVMRGDSDDDAEVAPSISERIRAAQELAKHQIEAKDKLQQTNRKLDITIVLDWERPDDTNITKAETFIDEDNKNISDE